MNKFIVHFRERLSAPDLIIISKVADYIQNKLEGKNSVELLCMDQVRQKGGGASTLLEIFH